MTRDDVVAMQPGRELDALVAEHIFPGSKDVFVPTWSDKNWPYQWDADGNEITWKPSTDISAAWEVVEKFDKNTFNLNWLDWDNHFGEGWHCKLEDAHAHKCSSAPEAICKAALLAVMGVNA